MTPVAGIFVGGRGARMGGAAKGLLATPDGRPIVERVSDLLQSLGLEVVLVGRDARYDSLGLRALEDEPSGIGPLGGLIALLRHAGGRAVLALACDMPFIDLALLGRLLDAPAAPVVAPRRENRWEPLFARYDSQRVLPTARARAEEGLYSLQGLLDAVGAKTLALDLPDWTALEDWDSPADQMAGVRGAIGAGSPHRARSDEDMLQEYPRRSRTPDWFIRVEEVSAGVCRVSARNRWGHECGHTGSANTDEELEKLVEVVESYIANN